MPSAWTDHPSRNATGLYKFNSFQIELDQKIAVTNRAYYGILDWLRDVGGLSKAILAIGSIVVTIFTSYNLKSELLTTLFRVT